MIEKINNISDENSKNREKRVNVLLNFLEKAKNINAFHENNFFDTFSNKNNKKQFIQNLDEEEFISLLDGINGILRNKKKEEWGMDGEHVLVGNERMIGYYPPAQRFKKELLYKVLNASKIMINNNESMSDIALLNSASLNAIHPYLDGNGRTSRFLYLLLSKDYPNNKKEIQKELSSSTVTEDLKNNINPELIQYELTNIIRHNLNIKTKNDHINPEDIVGLWGADKITNSEKNKQTKELTKLSKKDGEYIFLAIMKFINNRSFKNEFTIKFPKFSKIEVEKLIEKLETSEIEEIFKNYHELKKEYVEKLIDCIVNPEKKEYQIQKNKKETSLKQYFKNKGNLG
jgi:hypothetical protein